MSFTPRPYQTNLKLAISTLWQQGERRVILQASTGAGKTAIACDAVREVRHGQPWRQVLYIVPRSEILDQTSAKLDEFQVPHFVLSAGKKFDAAKVKQIGCVLAMSQTLAVRLKSGAIDGWHPDVIIIDEMHFLVEQHYRVLEQFPNAFVLSQSATPMRLDEKALDVFGPMLQGPQVGTFQKLGFLVPCLVVRGAHATATYRKVAGEYDNQQVAASFKAIMPVVPKLWHTVAKNRRTICFCATVDQSMALAELYRRNGIRAVHVDGDTKPKIRDAALQALRKHEIDVLCNVNLFVEGLDLVEIECITLCTKTASLARYIQMVGRGMRISPKTRKTNLILIDHCANVEQHDAPDADRNWAALAGVEPALIDWTHLADLERAAAARRAAAKSAALSAEKRNARDAVVAAGRRSSMARPQPVARVPVQFAKPDLARAVARSSRDTPARSCPDWALAYSARWTALEIERVAQCLALPQPGRLHTGYVESRLMMETGLRPTGEVAA